MDSVVKNGCKLQPAFTLRGFFFFSKYKNKVFISAVAFKQLRKWKCFIYAFRELRNSI